MSEAYRKRRGEGGDRRQEILTAAKQVFLAEGYDRASMRKIAARVGVSPTALYLYFRDKDELLTTIGEATFAELTTAFAGILETAADPLDRLRHIMRAYIQFGLEHPDEYRLIFMTPVGLRHGHHRADLALPEATGGRGATAFAFLQQQVGGLMAAGLCAPGDPAALAEVIWAAGHGLVALLITNPAFPWSDRAALIDTLCDVLLRGLR